MLTVATIPQAARLWRTRDASGFAWSFVALNLVGILLLAWRSHEIGERAFLALNLSTAAFWALVISLKWRAFQGARHKGQPPRVTLAKHAEG